METQWNELTDRLDRAEREARAMRRQMQRGRLFTLAAIVGAITFVATRPAATQSQIVSIARGGQGTTIKGPLTVVDGAGRPILQVTTNPIGRGMVLFDEAGKMVCGIGLTNQGRGLVVYDAQQKLVAALGQGTAPDGRVTGRGLTLFDPIQNVLGTLGMGENGPSQGRGLTLNDETGAAVAGLGVWPQRPDRGQLVLADRSGNTLFAQQPLQ
jgi:hypothetical protein